MSYKKEPDVRSCDEWKIVVAKNFEEIEAIREIWEQMQRSESTPVINTDIDRYVSVLKAIKGAIQPYVIVLYQDGDPKAMVIGRIERQQIACRVGYTTIFKPSLRCLTVVYGGVLGQPSDRISTRVYDELINTLKRGDVDVVFLNHLHLDSHLQKLSSTKPPFLCRDHFPVQWLHWKSLLPGNYEEFLRCRSKNTRHNIRRYQKRLVDKYGDRLSIKCFTETEQIDQLFRDTVEVAEKTYQRNLGSTFVDDVITRSRVKLFLDHKLLIAYILYIDGKPRAFWNGTRYRKTFFTWTTGYDPAFQNDRLGLFLLVKLIEKLCLDQNVDAIDFGFGDAQYKQSFCDVSWPEISIYIFAPRFYPVFVNLLRNSVEGVDTGLKYVVKKFGAVGWIKRHWRNVLLPKNQSTRD